MAIERRPLILQECLLLRSRFLGRAVTVDLYIPPSIGETGRVSLLLINDGQDMGKLGLKKILDGLYREKRLQPLLCAGIHAGPQRKMEYGTASSTDYLGRGAQAPAYTAFILQELVPRIGAHCGKTRIGDKAFAGFSLGALSAMDIVWNHPDEFNRAGLFSGAFWWRSRDKDDPAYRDDTDRLMHSEVRQGSFCAGIQFFFECGTEDEEEDRNGNGVIDSIDDTRDLILELMAKGYKPDRDLRYLEIAGGKHDIATWSLAMPEFLEWGWGYRT